MIRFLIFAAATWGIVVLTDWKAVEPYEEIPWDLEATPLQIKTDSTLGSGDMILVQMYDKDSSSIGMVKVYFEPQMGYDIAFCTSVWFTELPVQPPGEVEKIWTIAKTETAIIITCNGVEVLNYLFADSSMSDCVPRMDSCRAGGDNTLGPGGNTSPDKDELYIG
uniref:Putative secretory peptide-55 n=1 Tax=Pleurobrachia bachei TaxID=34499 RepID=M4H1W5_PLEBA|nr:putative secretory peptide-55 [Pleurobrachia bachei]|eukprot:sb/3472582/